ncbi:MAG: LptF/LptG family permease [Bacteroidota bacterium]
MKTVHRYIILDYLGQLALCTVGISIFMIGFTLYQEAANLVNYRVPLAMVLWLLANRWPMVLLDVMPGAGLFAVILSLGRMVREREFQVFRLSGWSFPRIVWPLLALTLAMSYGVFLWNNHMVPASEHRYAQAWAKLTRERIYNFVATQTFIAGPDNTHFYIGSIDKRTGEMKNVLVYQENPGAFPRFITALEGRMEGQVWILKRGVLHEVGPDGYVTFESGFDRMTVNTKRDWSHLFANQLGPREMNRAQLRAMAEKYDDLARPAQGYIPANGYWLEYHLKLASPFALFVFTTLAIPFACLGGRAGRLAVFTPALILYFSYFLLLTVLYSLGTQGIIQPWLAAWGSNLLFGTVACVLLVTLVK